MRDGFYVSPQLQTGENSFDVPCDRTKRPPSGNDPTWPLGELRPPKFVHRYGYYECRCKFQKYPEEMWSAFWTQSPSIGARFEPEGYVFYCDGKEVSRCNAHVSHVPQFILLTTEVRGYRRIQQMKARGDDLTEAKFAVKGDFVDDAFIVDFVRVYDKIG